MRRAIALLVVSLTAAVANAQTADVQFRVEQDFGRRGEGGGGRGMMRMMGGSPDELFERFSKGKSSIRRDDLNGMEQMMFDRITRDMNIQGNEINRDQFKKVFETMQTRFRDGGMGGMGGGGPNPEMMDRFMDGRFRGYDKNGDGLLQLDEMPETMKAERDKWDTNKDGFIDLNEYKAYAKARFETMRGERGGNSGGPATPAAPGQVPTQPINPNVPAVESDDVNRRPVVYRAGKLPDNLPEWFKQLDIDVDGQVGLYEWAKGGKPVIEFREMDANDDSFLTAEEVIRFTSVGKSFNYNAVAVNNGNSQPAYGYNRDRGSMWTGDGSGDRRGGDMRRGGGPGGGNWGNRGGGPGGGGPGSGDMRRGGGPGGGNWGNRGGGPGSGEMRRGGPGGGGPGGGGDRRGDRSDRRGNGNGNWNGGGGRQN